MKVILIIVFLFVIQNSYSQTDAKKHESKPSWGSKMPTREETPNLKFDADLDDEDEMDMGDFGMDRTRLLDSDDSEINRDDLIQVERPVITSDDGTDQNEIKAEEKRVAAELMLQEQERKDNEKRIADEQLVEQQRKAEEEKIAAEQLAEKQRTVKEKNVADKQLKEKQRKEEERRVVEKIKQEPTQEEVLSQQDQLAEVVVKAPAQIQPYVWKKIKNVLPVYPTKAAREKKEGWVEVNITIDVTGNVANAEVSRSSRNYRIFNNAALKAVRKWKYEPPSDYGVNNQLSKVVRIVFKL